MTSLLLLRHAESEWNAEGRWQGVADPPLSAAGRQQAVAAGQRLQELGLTFTALVASDLDRARHTALLMAPALGFSAPIAIEPGLREHDVGQWSGLTRAQIEARWPGALAEWRSGRLVAAPGGERRDLFVARVTATIRRVASAHEDETLLVITHGGVIGSLVRSLGEQAGRTPHVAGRWIHAGRDRLVAGGVVVLDPGLLPEVAEGEGTEYAATDPGRSTA